MNLRPIQSSKVTYKPVLNIFSQKKKKNTRKQNQDYFRINTQQPQFSLIALEHAILKVRQQTKVVEEGFCCLKNTPNYIILCGILFVSLQIVEF